MSAVVFTSDPPLRLDAHLPMMTQPANHLPCSPPSPTSSSTTTTTLADRRQTKTSKYLGSHDFKSDFAVKLQSVRERERGLLPLPLATPVLADLSPCQVPLPLSPPSPRASSPILHKHHGSSSNSPPSSTVPSTSRQSADDEDEQGARYEVIRKLADQLAEQIEQNDNLLYELGVMRASQARLHAAAADRDDELACLRQQIEGMPTGHHPEHCTRVQADSVAMRHQLEQARRALCRLQLGGNHAGSQSDACRVSKATRRSWPGGTAPSDIPGQATPRALSPSMSPSQVRSPPGSSQRHTSPSASPVDSVESLEAEINQLRAELRDCQEARAASQATLEAFIELVRTQPSAEAFVEHVHSPGREKARWADHKPGRPWGLGILRGRESVVLEEEKEKGKVDRAASLSSQHSATSPFATFGLPARWRRRSDAINLPEVPQSAPVEPPQEIIPVPESRVTPFRFNLGAFFSASPKPEQTALSLPTVPSAVNHAGHDEHDPVMEGAAHQLDHQHPSQSIQQDFVADEQVEKQNKT